MYLCGKENTVYFTKNRLNTLGEKSTGFLYKDINVLCWLRELQLQRLGSAHKLKQSNQEKCDVCVCVGAFTDLFLPLFLTSKLV